MMTMEQDAKNTVPAILKDPALLFKIKQVLDKHIAGEDNNKMLLFIISATSFTQTPLGAIITGTSSAGKSWLVGNVLTHFENVHEFTRMTEASPERMQGDFTNKILYIGELYGAEQAQAKLRVLISEGKLRLLSTVQDEKTKGLTTEVIETVGIPVFITTTTSLTPDNELMNRLFMLSIDESEKHTKTVMKFEAEEFMTFPDHLGEYKSPVTSIFSDLLVTDYKIPFADILARVFPARNVKSRRDFKKLMILIGTVAVLHQYQRPIVQRKNIKLPLYVLALPVDFYLAFRIAGDSLQSTLMNVQARALEALETFNSETLEQTATKVSVSIRRALSTTRQLLNNLVHQGFLLRDDSKKPYKYKVLSDKNDFACSVARFEDVFKLFDENKLKQYIESNNLDARTHSYSDSCIDPLTGNEVKMNEMFASLQKLSIRASFTIPTETITTDLIGKTRDLTSFSEIEDVKEKLSIAERMKKFQFNSIQEMLEVVRKEIDDFSEEQFIMSCEILNLPTDGAKLLFKDLQKDGAIFSKEPDVWSWT